MVWRGGSKIGEEADLLHTCAAEDGEVVFIMHECEGDDGASARAKLVWLAPVAKLVSLRAAVRTGLGGRPFTGLRKFPCLCASHNASCCSAPLLAKPLGAAADAGGGRPLSDFVCQLLDCGISTSTTLAPHDALTMQAGPFAKCAEVALGKCLA